MNEVPLCRMVMGRDLRDRRGAREVERGGERCHPWREPFVGNKFQGVSLFISFKVLVCLQVYVSGC